jgi:predicted LPLAT superfamily acyltransferase
MTDAVPSTAAREAPADPATWLNQRERGAVFLIRALAFWATRFGRRPARALVRMIALYYALFDRVAVAASRRWLEAVRGESPSFRHVYAHILCFAQVTLDRLFLLRRATRGIEVERTGSHHLEALAREGRGAILLGAHLGSFEAMRVAGDEERFPVHIVGHFENAKMINAVLSELDPEMAGRVVHVGGDPIALALTLRERVESGGMLALLADRVGLNDKTVEVTFFGRPALFPTGPFLLAAALKCPVLLVFGLYFEPNRYELYCEPFAERLVLPRKERAAALARYVQAYAERLEGYARRAPYNWFNFYDFWETTPR